MTTDKNNEEESGGVISITGEDNEEMYLYCILPEDFVSEHGLLNISVVGKFTDNIKDKNENLVVDSFQANPEFVNMFHEFLERSGRKSESVLSKLPNQEEGSWVYLIDQRVKGSGADNQAKDIIGGYKIEDGTLGEYAGNPGHVLLTEDGIFQIGNDLKAELIDFIKSKYQLH